MLVNSAGQCECQDVMLESVPRQCECQHVMLMSTSVRV